MFRQCVYSTALTGETANMVFSDRIFGESYGSDETFLATMRALLDTRMPEGRSVGLYFGSQHVTKESALDESPRFLRNIRHGNDEYVVYDIRTSADSVNDVFNVIENKFTQIVPGFKELKKVRDFYKNSFRVVCFLNEETRSVCMFVLNMTLRKLHYLQCAILCSLPWYFNASNGITDDERALISSLQDKDRPDRYIEAIKKIAERYDFNTYRVKKLLTGIETEYEKTELRRVDSEVERYDDMIRSLNDQYADLNRRRRDACIKRAGLRESINRGPSDDSDLMNYFMRNKHLYLEDVDGVAIRFSVWDYMTYYDEESLGSYLRNKHSYIYGDTNDVFTKTRVEKLMRALFLDEKLKLRVCASYTITLNGSVSANRNGSFKDFGGEFLSCMPNPHINRYSCLGGYEPKINEALTCGNYIMAIEQCVASAKSLNFHDDTVIGYFMENLCRGGAGSDDKYIELPDGRIVSPVEALEWLEQNEG